MATELCQCEIESYVESCPGKRDILRFSTSSEASDAANAMRKITAGSRVLVDSKYDKVFLTLKKEQA
jgi:hypothetical protein